METGAKKFTAAALIGLFVASPGFLAAQGRRGANIVVTLKDMSQVGGELVAVKPDSLLVLSYVGKDESLRLADIESVTMKGKSKGGTGFGVGFLVGGIAGGVMAAKLIKDHRTEMPTFTAIVMPLLTGSLAGLIGLGVGSATRSKGTIQIAGISEEELARVLTDLRRRARLTGLP